jgi:sulfite reductase (NADPH) hemoprotein beta-component
VQYGVVTCDAQWLAIDDLATKYGNDAFKLTTRQAYQLHGVVKRNLKLTIQKINAALMDTIAACGDVNRNVMCNPAPVDPRMLAAVQVRDRACVRVIADRHRTHNRHSRRRCRRT